MHSFYISYSVKLAWPPKGLRNRLVARGRKRLCTTDLCKLDSRLNHVIGSPLRTCFNQDLQLHKKPGHFEGCARVYRKLLYFLVFIGNYCIFFYSPLVILSVAGVSYRNLNDNALTSHIRTQHTVTS